jgi:predicted PurR-regulated permease PerM
MADPAKSETMDWVSLAAAFVVLVLVLELGLVVPLLCGFLVHLIIHGAVPHLGKLGLPTKAAKLAALILTIVVVVLGIETVVLALRPWFSGGPDNVIVLLGKVADIINEARSKVPGWIASKLPANPDEIESMVVGWLRANAYDLQKWGTHLGMVLVKSVIAMVIGALVALHDHNDAVGLGPFSSKLRDRVIVFSRSFRDVALSQIRISALNTLLTGIYLALLLPLFGIQLPLVKTMIAVTLLAGLLPIIGNLISNTVIVIVSLSVSLGAAIASLVFLVIIHKLEYFVNARIVGSRIHARAWELLLAMLTLEAWHGGAGLVAAPIFYAYLKQELANRHLI